MSITLDVLTNRELTESINLIPTVPEFFLSKFFGNTQYHEEDTIDWEVFTGKEGLAYFENDGGPGKVISQASRVAKSIKIPFTKEKKIFTVKQLAAYKSLSEVYASAERKRRMKAEFVQTELNELKERVLRRRELMAAQALSTGLVTASQDNIDFSIDFEFTTHASTGQKYTLPGGSKWSDNGVSPFTAIDNYARIIAKRSGKNVTDIVLGYEAADVITKDTTVMDALHNNNYKTGVIDMTQQYTNGVRYLGRLRGIDLWEYVGSYIASDGSTVTDIFGSKLCLMVANHNQHLKLHRAAIDTLDNAGSPIKVADDIAIAKYTDPEGEFVQWTSKQKSLPVVHNKNLIYSLTVL